MKIVKLLEESGLLKQGISQTIKNKQKNKKADFSQCCQEHQLLVVLGNALAGRGVIRAGEGAIRAGKKC